MPPSGPNSLPTARIPNLRVCPFEALTIMFERISRGLDAPCFLLSSGEPLTYRVFQRMLKEALKRAGYEASEFSSHSLRAGGVTWVSRTGVPLDMIKILGNWKSDAYERYIENPTQKQEEAGLLMRKAIMKKGW